MLHRILSQKIFSIVILSSGFFLQSSRDYSLPILQCADAFGFHAFGQLYSHSRVDTSIFSTRSDLKNKHISSEGGLPKNGNFKKGKKRQRKKMKAKKGSSQLDHNHHKSGPVTDDDIAQHVASMYINGPGGLMKEATTKREKQDAQGMFGDEEHLALLKNLDRHPALVLNADYQPLSVLPLSVWSWQETIKGVFTGKVVVVDVYPGVTVRAVNVDVPLPSVIALTEFCRQPNQNPAFTRRNVFLRDGYVCQYCGNKFMTRDLSLDHVTPRCVGGKLEWENTVTACRKCNGKKGSTLPRDLKRIGMKLIREPRIPSKWELAANAQKMVPKKVHETWKPFLGMNMLPEDGKDEEYLFFDEAHE